MCAEQAEELKSDDMIDEFGIPDVPMDTELVVSMLDDLKSLLEGSGERLIDPAEVRED